MISPTKYTPMSAAEFVGEARHYAAIFEGMVADSRANGFESIKVLVNGEPGIGKSALVKYLGHLLGCDEWSIKKMNGTEVKMETVGELANAMHYSSLGGDYTMFWIDEADKINPTAQVRFLTMLDDLPDGVVVACTSNCRVDEFEKRFQSRFQVCELGAPNTEEVAELLQKWPLPQEYIADIAKNSRGNVRQALLDARTALNSLPR